MDELKVVRLWLIAICAVFAMGAGCTVNERYQERTFKEAAMGKGFSATDVSCAWSRDATICAILAAKK